MTSWFPEQKKVKLQTTLCLEFDRLFSKPWTCTLYFVTDSIISKCSKAVLPISWLLPLEHSWSPGFVYYLYLIPEPLPGCYQGHPDKYSSSLHLISAAKEIGMENLIVCPLKPCWFFIPLEWWYMGSGIAKGFKVIPPTSAIFWLVKVTWRQTTRHESPALPLLPLRQY